jgi:Aerobic-type carbon monoxide dehydrogenase, middle subunit CoxM/CutM homologs
VLQRTRCPYFRAEEPLPWPCNKRDPGSGCTSLAGRHERQAIFGWTQDCVAVSPPIRRSPWPCSTRRPTCWAGRAADDPDAGVPPDPARGGRRRPADARDPARTRRADHRLPAPASADGQAYVKVRERASYEYAIVSAAAAVRLDRGLITGARVALGSVAQRPWR